MEKPKSPDIEDIFGTLFKEQKKTEEEKAKEFMKKNYPGIINI